MVGRTTIILCLFLFVAYVSAFDNNMAKMKRSKNIERYMNKLEGIKDKHTFRRERMNGKLDQMRLRRSKVQEARKSGAFGKSRGISGLGKRVKDLADRATNTRRNLAFGDSRPAAAFDSIRSKHANRQERNASLLNKIRTRQMEGRPTGLRTVGDKDGKLGQGRGALRDRIAAARAKVRAE